jgi:hypothetical protein
MGARRAGGLEPVFPAVKIPVNIAKEAMSYNPLGLLRIPMGLFGGQMKLPGGQMIDQASKALVGGGIAAAVYGLAASDRVTGEGPADAGKRQIWLQTHQPNSVRVGDSWYGLDRAEPVGASVSLIADVIHIAREDQADQVWKDATHAFGGAILSKTFAQTLQGVLDMAYGLEAPGPVLGRIAGTAFVPGAVAQAARAADPMQRDQTGFIPSIQARIPGLRQQLPPKVDYRGQEVPAQGTGPINRMMPISSTPVRGDEIDRMASQLGVSATPIPRTLAFSGRTLQLSPREHANLQKLAGQYVNENLQDLDLSDADPDEQRQAFAQAIRQGRAQAHREFVSDLMESRDMPARFGAAKIRQGARPQNPFD